MELFHAEFYRMVRAARALLGWSQSELAKKAEISLSTLNRLERGEGYPNMKSLGRIFFIFEEEGIRLVQNGPHEFGVMLTLRQEKS